MQVWHGKCDPLKVFCARGLLHFSHPTINITLVVVYNRMYLGTTAYDNWLTKIGLEAKMRGD